MRGHGISGQTDDDGGNQVPLGPTIPAPAQPHAQKTGAPPDNTHRRVLQIIVNPWSAPAMLGKGIDTAPCGDDERIEEFLTPAGSPQPVLADKKKNGQADTIRDECAAHDEVRQTLAHVITLAEAERGNTTEEHLRPADNGHDLADDAVRQNEDPSNSSLSGLFKVQFQVEAQDDLRDQEQHQPIRERGVCIFAKLSTLVSVAEEVC